MRKKIIRMIFEVAILMLVCSSKIFAGLRWVQLFPTGTMPEARQSPGAVYVKTDVDSFGSMYIFGGTGASLYNNMFKLTLRPQQESWTSVTIQGSWPEPRTGFVMAYDKVNNKILGFGGDKSNYIVVGDNWQFDIDSMRWERLDTTVWFLSPNPRVSPYVCYNDSEGTMILFGGTAFPNWWKCDAWKWNLASAAWEQLSPYGEIPFPRQGGVSVYDRMNDRMIFFGGQKGTNQYGELTNETWSLGPLGSSLCKYELLHPTGNPPPNIRHSVAVYDQLNQRMLVFGGGDEYGNYYNTIWSLSLQKDTEYWQTLTVGGTPPPGMFCHVAVFDEVNGRMIVFGGKTVSTQINDVYCLDSITTGVGSDPVGKTCRPSFKIYPIPSSGAVNFNLSVAKPTEIQISIYNINGQLVRTIKSEGHTTGNHTISWDGKDEFKRRVSSGVYLFKVYIGKNVFTGNITLIK